MCLRNFAVPLILMKTLKVSVWGEIGRLFLLLSWDSSVWVEEGLIWFSSGRWGGLHLDSNILLPCSVGNTCSKWTPKISETNKGLHSLGKHPRTMPGAHLKIIFYTREPRRKKVWKLWLCRAMQTTHKWGYFIQGSINGSSPSTFFCPVCLDCADPKSVSRLKASRRNLLQHPPLLLVLEIWKKIELFALIISKTYCW